MYRDYFDVNGYNEDYRINWSGISVPVFWVNSRLGYGGNVDGGIPIKNSGNTNVKVHLVFAGMVIWIFSGAGLLREMFGTCS